MNSRKDNKKLTICAIGSSGSSHVVSRVACFAERGHRVYLLCSTVSGLEGVNRPTSSTRALAAYYFQASQCFQY